MVVSVCACVRVCVCKKGEGWRQAIEIDYVRIFKSVYACMCECVLADLCHLSHRCCCCSQRPP